MAWGSDDGSPVAVAPGWSCVHVAGEVGHLDQVIELVGDEGEEGVAELVGRPVPAEAGLLAQGLEAAAEARQGDRRGVAGAEHEPSSS